MKKGIAIAAAVLALAVLAYTAAWFYGANRLEQAIADWKEEAEANGVSITHDEIQIGGYPVALTAVLPDLSMRAEAAGISMDVAPIRLRTALWTPNRIEYDFAGKHAFIFTGGVRPWRITIDVEAGTGEVVRDGDRREDRGTAANIRIVSDEGIITIAGLEVSGFADPQPADGGADSFHAVYALSGLEVSSRLGVKLFEPPIEQVRLDLAATGPFIEMFKNGTVVDWAEAGGVLTLRDFTLEWSGLALTASGSGSLDSELRPSGSLTLVSAGFEESLQSLENSGLMPPHIGRAIRQMTQRFVVPAGNGSKSELVVSITATNGILSVGGEPIAPIPSLKTL